MNTRNLSILLALFISGLILATCRLNCDDQVIHVGLGEYGGKVNVEVRWIGGRIQDFGGLDVNKRHQIYETEEKVMEIPKGFAGIVAYGSLMSLPSMEQTLGHKYEGPAHEIHLTGYERVWTCVRPFNSPQAAARGAKRTEAYLVRGTERIPVLGTAELNLYPKKKGRINGVLYLLTDEELGRSDQREWGYRRTDVTDKIEEFRFRGGRVYIYESPAGSLPAPPSEKGTYVLIKEFLDLVTGACDARGTDFRNEFDKSTRPCSYPIVSYKDVIWNRSK